MSYRFLAGLALPILVAGAALADDPKFPDAKEFDRLVVDSLKKVHNDGAELYNTRLDYAGAYRLYEGALLTIRPLLAHRPAAQKLIDEGLAKADLEPNMGLKAFQLHKTIESVRTLLKGGVTKPAEPKKSTETKATESKAAAPKTTTETKAAETKKPAPQYELAPMPREKKTTGGQ